MILNISVNIFCAALMVFSNTLLKFTLKNSTITWNGKLIDWLYQFILLLKKPTMWCAIILFLFSNLLWVFILSYQKLSVAYPLQITLVFVFSTSVTFFVFDERMSYSGIIGLIIIISGILLLVKN
jgi:multidrug transporter EmrE-like cation transporter